MFYRLETPVRIQSDTQSQLEREKQSILAGLGAEHLVFSREKHTSCWTGDKNQAFCHTHLAGGPYLHTLVHFPPRALFILAAIVRRFTSLASLISSISLPHAAFLFLPLSLPPFLVLSQDALMSAPTCCHIPPVPSSARHDRIWLNCSGRGRQQTRQTRIHQEGWKEPVRKLDCRTGGYSLDRRPPPSQNPSVPNLADTMTSGLFFPGSSSAPLRG